MRPSSFLLAAIGLFSLSGVANAQKVGQPSYANDPNVIVPESTRRPANEVLGRFVHTNHLLYVGPWNRANADEPPVLPFHNGGPFLTGGPSGYHPADLQAAYQIPGGLGTGAIAVVDAYNLPTALNDFNVYASQFGLPQETSLNATASGNKVFQVVYQTSGTPPATNGSWGQEEALDMEMAHAMASGAKVYLVEANSNSFSDLLAAVTIASTLPGVTEVSMSWGGGEFSGENTYDTNFSTSGVTYFAATGDSNADKDYPAMSTSVVGVGGTSLDLSGGVVSSETVWADSGGGLSAYYSRPAFQNGVSSVVGSARGIPDVSAVGDPNTGVSVYDSTAYGGYSGWLVFGGTSVATPIWAGVTNARGQYSTSTNAELTRQYGFLGGPEFRDITSGTAGTRSAAVGYDLASGIGAPTGLLPSSGATTFTATTVSPYYSTLVSGNAASLTSVDGNDYVLGSALNSSGWEVAGLSATFNLTFPGNAATSTANVLIYATQPTASEIQLYALNTSTNSYDFIEQTTLGGGTGSLNISLNVSKYVTSAGKLQLILRSADPSVGGVSPPAFNFSVDQLVVSATPVSTSGTYNVSTVAPYYSTLVSGNAASLSAIDGNDYTLATSLNSSNWDVAGLQATFNVTLSTIHSASLTIYATEPTGAQVQFYALNTGTGNYDFISQSSIAGASGSLTFAVPSISKYFTSAGKISVIIRSVDLPVGGVTQPSYNFGVDLLQVNAS